ncbi:MAG TPA: cysteine synthase family protein [Feifaniaceae bacterium]|nr:cysteine synthase family protein [Feifaniaceae bacterium]
MGYINDVRELIGNTPLLKLNRMDFAPRANVFAKLELWNPGGSVKDRMGTALLEDAEQNGRLKPGGAIVEPTAGNAGIGIALAALGKGYRVIFVVPEKFSVEKQAIMRAYGAEIVHTPLQDGIEGAIEKAKSLLAEIEGSVTLGQFTNAVNPAAHYRTTGPELYEQLAGAIDYVVAGAGSGGTFTGVLRYLKERVPNVKGVLADPYGSTMGGGEPGCYAIEGIGNTFMPDTMDMELVDQVIKVADEAALREVRLLAAREGVFAGSSSGAAVAAVRALVETGVSGNIAVILPDRGDRYFSKNLLGL